MYHENLIRQVGQYLNSPEDFMNVENKVIYRAMLKLNDLDISINLLTVEAELEKQKANIGREYLQQLIEFYTVDVNDVVSIARQLSEFASQRLLEAKVETVMNTIRSREQSVQEYLGMLESTIAEISKKNTTTTTYTGKLLTNSFLDFLNTKGESGILTGLPVIDKTIFNLFGGEITLIAARPGVGKTTLLLQGSLENLKIGKKVGFITMEMEPHQLLLRLIAHHTDIDSRIVREFNADNPDDPHYDVIVDALDYFENAPLFIDSAAPYNLSTVLSTIRKLKYVHDIDILYLDYIQLIDSDNANSNGYQRNAELTVISRKLKNLAGELGIPCVTAAQLSRAVENRVGQRPILSDLRESGSLEQDASIVGFLYPDLTGTDAVSSEELKAKLKTLNTIPIMFEIAKARSGPLNIFKVDFHKPTSKLTLRDTEFGFPEEPIANVVHGSAPWDDAEDDEGF